MKTKAILLASLCLAGCHTPPPLVKQDTSLNEFYAENGFITNSNDVYFITDEEDTFNEATSDIDSAGKLARGTQAIPRGKGVDLWHYVGSQLRMPIPDNSRVQQQTYRYLNKRDDLREVSRKAEPYMYWIIDELKKRSLPMELALVPMVESTFNPQATSSAQAAGLWQIIPKTGRQYGLRQNQWVDDRRDVAASTRAALDYLQRLNAMFKRDWALALAAYNCGEGCVQNAIKRNQAKGLPTDFWSLSLPRETMQYVPKILALSKLMRNTNKYNIHLPKSNQNRALTKVSIGKQVSLAHISSVTGLPIDTLKRYNSGYKKGVSSPDGPHHVMLPVDKATQYRLALSSKSTSSTLQLAKSSFTQQQPVKMMKTSLTQKKRPVAQLSAKTYLVRRGDSYSSIAKRHGIALKDLMYWNTGIKTADLKPGTALTLHL